MVKNIAIGELEILATTRVLCQRIKNREVFDRSDFLKQAFFSANDILRECGLVDCETLVSQLSFVRDAKETVELAEKEQEQTDAAFAKVEITDQNEVKDAQE